MTPSVQNCTYFPLAIFWRTDEDRRGYPIERGRRFLSSELHNSMYLKTVILRSETPRFHSL
jgi:hypothetical protein